MFGGTLGGIAVGTLGLGVSISPLMLSMGAWSACARRRACCWERRRRGPLLARGGRAALVPNAEPGSLNSWLIWPALGLLLAAGFLPMILESGAVVRSFRQFPSLWRARSGTPRATEDMLAPRVWMPLVLASVAAIFLTGLLAFGIKPIVMLIALAVTLSLAVSSARATGETDFGQAGPVGTLGLIATISHGPVSGIIGGSVGLGMTSQISQTLWALRAGRQLGASPRAQIGGQLLGMVVGAIVTVPVYYAIASSYGIGNERMPAVAGLTWKATAEAMRGVSALPRGRRRGAARSGDGVRADVAGPHSGRPLSTVRRDHRRRLSCSRFVYARGFRGRTAGAGLSKAFRGRGLDDTSMLAVAAGGMAGESSSASSSRPSCWSACSETPIVRASVPKGKRPARARRTGRD